MLMILSHFLVLIMIFKENNRMINLYVIYFWCCLWFVNFITTPLVLQQSWRQVSVSFRDLRHFSTSPPPALQRSWRHVSFGDLLSVCMYLQIEIRRIFYLGPKSIFPEKQSVATRSVAGKHPHVLLLAVLIDSFISYAPL